MKSVHFTKENQMEKDAPNSPEIKESADIEGFEGIGVILGLKKFWSNLLKSNTLKRKTLTQIIIKIESLRGKGWEELLKRGPTKEDLLKIIESVPSLREEAWQKLLELEPTSKELKKLSGVEDVALKEAIRARLRGI